MASVFKFQYDQKHGVCESTDMLATKAGGHFYNCVADVDIDNGSLIAVPTPENYVEQDYYKVVKPEKGDKVALVLTAPKIYEEYQTKNQEEAYFLNGKGELMRVYEVYETDRFTVSAECFDDAAVPAVKKYVTIGEDFKMTVVDSEPADAGFVGYIYAIASNGNYRIFVKRNAAV